MFHSLTRKDEGWRVYCDHFPDVILSVATQRLSHASAASGSQTTLPIQVPTETTGESRGTSGLHRPSQFT